jgi:segregation and condensation protein B
VCYGTSQSFLEHFGLEGVKDLPGLEELKAAGLLAARVPTGFVMPSPDDTDDSELDPLEEGEIAESSGDPDSAA